MNPYRSSIHSDIHCIELFIYYINKLSEQYKEYYTKALIKFKNNIIFDSKTQTLYRDKFDKLNINLSLFIKKYILKIIIYITNLFDKYNIAKRVILFNTFNFLYKEYIWIEKIEDLTVSYIVFDLNIISNYFLDKLIIYKNKRKNWNGYVFSGELCSEENSSLYTHKCSDKFIVLSYEDREKIKNIIAKKNI